MLDGDLEKDLREVNRILKPDGQMICTVATDTTQQDILVVDVLKKPGLASMAARVRKKQVIRFGIWEARPHKDWIQLLENTGFTVHSFPMKYGSGVI